MSTQCRLADVNKESSLGKGTVCKTHFLGVAPLGENNVHPSGSKLTSEVSAFCPVSGTAVPIGQYSGACFDRRLLCNSFSHPPAPQAFTATVLGCL